MWHIDDILRATGGFPHRVMREAFNGISTDSRTIREGELFVPLSGPNFDGHLFVAEAQRRSLGGFLCEKSRRDIAEGTEGTAILVDDAARALLDLAGYRRRALSGTVVAVTGSNGKTTTKEILVHMLRGAFSVGYNEKNLNNLVGVPKTLLSASEDPDIWVLELGTNARGEIGKLARAVEPDISLITNINPSHLEGLGSLEGIFEEKLDVYRFTRAGGKILLNADDPLLSRLDDSFDAERHTFSVGSPADFRLTVLEDRGWEGYRIALDLKGDTAEAVTTLLGRHNLSNLLAASAVASLVGLHGGHISEAIQGFSAYAMRFYPRRARGGYTVVDDTYNANPASMEAALKALGELPCRGRRIAILGEMRELGEGAAKFHRGLGRFINGGGVDRALFLGPLMREALDGMDPGRGEFFERKEDLIGAARRLIAEGDTVLVKGSRLSHMEEIVEALL